MAIFLTWLGGERGTPVGIVLTSFSSFLAVLQPTLAFQVLALAEIHTVRQLFNFYLFILQSLTSNSCRGAVLLEKKKKECTCAREKEGEKKKTSFTSNFVDQQCNAMMAQGARERCHA